jgi:tetratricopeptide (TPR) repeat protein
MNYEQLLKQGDSLANQGKVEEAFAEYTQARELDPARPEAHKQIINLALKKEDFPTVFEEYLNWANFLHSQGNLDEAAKTLLDALSLEGHHGKRSFLDRRSSHSSRLKEHSAKYTPRLYEAIGEIYFEKKDYDHAIEYLEKASESSSNTKTYTLQGLSYLAKGQFDKAKGPFQEVVRFQGPESALAYEKLAEIYASQGNTTQMIIWLKDAVNEYLKQDNHQMGIQAMERILETEPSNKEILNKLAESYFKIGDTASAIQTYKLLAESYSQAGLYDKVILLYEKLAEWEPDNVETINHLINIYQMALNVDPGNLRARLQLIQNLIKIDSKKEAIEQLFQLASSYTEVGLEEEAATHYQKILDMDPSNSKAKELLNNFYAKTGKPLEEPAAPPKIEEKSVKKIRKIESPVPVNVPIQEKKPASETKTEIKEEEKIETKAKAETKTETKTLNSEDLWRQAKALFEQGQIGPAAEFLEKLLETDPKRSEAQILMTKVYETELLREMEEFSHITG